MSYLLELHSHSSTWERLSLQFSVALAPPGAPNGICKTSLCLNKNSQEESLLKLSTVNSSDWHALETLSDSDWSFLFKCSRFLQMPWVALAGARGMGFFPQIICFIHVRIKLRFQHVTYCSFNVALCWSQSIITCILNWWFCIKILTLI